MITVRRLTPSIGCAHPTHPAPGRAPAPQVPLGVRRQTWPNSAAGVRVCAGLEDDCLIALSKLAKVQVMVTEDRKSKLSRPEVSQRVIELVGRGWGFHPRNGKFTLCDRQLLAH